MRDWRAMTLKISNQHIHLAETEVRFLDQASIIFGSLVLILQQISPD